jgi:hypothetical protein
MYAWSGNRGLWIAEKMAQLKGSGFEIFTHEKWMELNGNFKGSLGKHVWTGSDNWSDISNNNDEATIHAQGAGYYSRYVDNLNLIWNRWSRPL